MKYIYNKNQTRTSEAVETFLRVMGKIDQIQKTIDICNDIDDDSLREALEGKQSRLIQKMTTAFRVLYGINGKYTINELTANLDLIEIRNQEQISSIEDQVKDYWRKNQ